ncbi:type II restriction endonuclease [Kamptonema cortianum]|nr:type II restriction endonuclease [Oscillatoria laete-virens]MDK3157944.1 type II restriction endonuclease [Kamptonema cortianum]MDL5046071.1 type II restriction endonuclease [Oscillatoria amoena NRMC-F 0135]MDL5052778.1 type II restriction endonuclease [Oscillatoria laete-virens NRMC-F 0139]
MFNQEIALTPSPHAEKAIETAFAHGKAIVKFISPNDVGETGSHQCGYLLPKNAWKAFTEHPPQKVKTESNPREKVRILWQNGRETNSVITWYGRKTRSEYRLTRFGKDFPYLTKDNIGSMLVLIPVGERFFHAFVLDTDADFEAISSALGVDTAKSWALFDSSAGDKVESENDCINRHFQNFLGQHASFPKSITLAEAAQTAFLNCVKDIVKWSSDDKLSKLMHFEYELFKMLERKVCQSEITRLFKDVDDFVGTASSIVNRRKSRAGRSLEHHVGFLLKQAGVPFESQPDIDGRPDIVIPSSKAYCDSSYPDEKLIVLGLKTTCKDRWRQVLNEGKRVKSKHLLTLQHGITEAQMNQMEASSVSLIVPSSSHKYFPKSKMGHLLSVENFISKVKEIHK